ncbi:MAG: Ldh family oxidoreductase [Nocardioides sp.]|uniref:Ldh family oxidoreductase n=1 Tax=Nocardioides sp. TaxID=35761 RepID=UPI0039E6AC44
MRRASAAELRRFASSVSQSHGVPPDEADLLADTLVVAELWGHASHGMLRLPWYVDRIVSGATEPACHESIPLDHGAVVVLDGNNGLGQVVSQRAVGVAIERAREHGISAVGVRNSGHFGTAAYFTRQIAEAGCVSILATNASPAMAPWGGREKRIGTNPWSIAAPAGDAGVTVLDIANTAVARGKIYLADEKNLPIPEGWAADADGAPTTDAKAAIDGLILPMAGHKGYIISFMMDVLAGVLTGSAFGRDVVGPYHQSGRSGVGHLFITIDVASMLDADDFAARMARLIDEVKSTPLAAGVEEIFYPGEIEDRNAARIERQGIAVADDTWTSLEELAVRTGVPLPAELPIELTAEAAGTIADSRESA